jgi:hypothetical protein
MAVSDAARTFGGVLMRAEGTLDGASSDHPESVDCCKSLQGRCEGVPGSRTTTHTPTSFSKAAAMLACQEWQARVPLIMGNPYGVLCAFWVRTRCTNFPSAGRLPSLEFVVSCMPLAWIAPQLPLLLVGSLINYRYSTGIFLAQYPASSPKTVPAPSHDVVEELEKLGWVLAADPWCW